jgi:hypothetical protein
MIYKLTQNNSGGSFDVDKKICHRLFVEAVSENDAVLKFENLGVYWDGVDSGIDCSCCGNRWSKYGIDLVDLPRLSKLYEKTFNTIEDYVQHLVDEYSWTKPDARIFYKNGQVKEIYSKRRTKNEQRK